MEVDVQKSREENKELADDTIQLTQKYEELLTETTEKKEIMTKQLEEQGSKQGEIQSTLDEQIDN